MNVSISPSQIPLWLQEMVYGNPIKTSNLLLNEGAIMHHVKIFSEVCKLHPGQRLSENVCNLLLYLYVLEVHYSNYQDHVKVEENAFAAFMEETARTRTALETERSVLDKK